MSGKSEPGCAFVGCCTGAVTGWLAGVLWTIFRYGLTQATYDHVLGNAFQFALATSLLLGIIGAIATFVGKIRKDR